MLERYFPKSTLTLSMPDSSIQLEAYFSAVDYFVSDIDIDYIGCISNFPNIRNLHLPTFQIAHLSEPQASSPLSTLLSQHINSQLICTSQEDDFSSILIIVPKSPMFSDLSFKEFDFVLLKFSITDLQGDSPQPYTSYLKKIKSLNSQIQKKNSDLYTKLRVIGDNKKKKNEELGICTETHSLLLSGLGNYKQRILELNKEYELLQEEEQESRVWLRCNLCENNLRNVIYLPCGHFILCTECLRNNLKTNIGEVVPRKNGFNCEMCGARVRETRKGNLI